MENQEMRALELSGRLRVQIADVLHQHYSSLEHGYDGQERIDPLPSLVRGVFGKSRLTHYPQYPQKKIRDFIEGLSTADILKLLRHLSRDDGFGDFDPIYQSFTDELTQKLNEILKQVGLQLHDGTIIHLTERSLGLIEDEETFLTALEDLGLSTVKESFDEGFKAFRTGDLLKASSMSCLALDSILKILITNAGGDVGNKSLGRLTDLAVDMDIIEEDIRTVFQGFVSLRNKAPQHASTTGGIDPLSTESTLLLIHLSRILTAYLMERSRAILP